MGGGDGLCALQHVLPSLSLSLSAKNIRNRPEANAKMTKRVLIKEYTFEVELLKARLQAQIAQNGVFLPPEEYDDLQVGVGGANNRGVRWTASSRPVHLQ